MGQYEVTAWASRAALPSGVIYRPADYAFIAPPEGLAAAMVETQSFTPYEGVVNVAAEEVGAVEYRGGVVNVTGSLPEHVGMKALVQRVDMDLEAGSEVVTLGTPARLNYLSLVNRFRRTASDNIVYI